MNSGALRGPQIAAESTPVLKELQEFITREGRIGVSERQSRGDSSIVWEPLKYQV
jgi:hypothetical protein